MRRCLPALAAAACGLLFVACATDSAEQADASAEGADGGTVVIALKDEPSTLMPPLVRSDHEQVITEVVYDRLADIGPALQTVGDAGFTPRLASSWRWSDDSLSIAFTLQPDARWHDGTAVSSSDVQRTFELYRDPLVGSPSVELIRNIDSVSTPDAQTAVFWFAQRSPLQFYDATYHMFVLPAHLLEGVTAASLETVPLARAPVGTGRFRFVAWRAGTNIEIGADTGNYRGRAHLDRVIYVTAPDESAAFINLATGEADFRSPLRSDDVGQIGALPDLKVVTYATLGYQYLAFNLRNPAGTSAPHPVLGDRAVRRAISMATDRARIVESVFDSLGVPAVAPSPSTYTPADMPLQPITHDPVAARALLDSAGWLPTEPDGVRARNGTPLRITILTPAGVDTRERMALMLQAQLKAVGVQVDIRALEIPTLVADLEAGRFDAFMGGLTVSPGMVGLRQNWGSGGIGPSGNNMGAYSNPVYDAVVDTFLTTFDPATASRTLAGALQILIDDAPGVWLAEPRIPAGMHRRINPGVAPKTGWWHALPDWRIRPADRIERDRLGLPAQN